MVPGHVAATVECLEALLEHGADLSVADAAGRTPLFVACATNRPACASLIMEVLEMHEIGHDLAADGLVPRDGRPAGRHAAARRGVQRRARVRAPPARGRHARGHAQRPGLDGRGARAVGPPRRGGEAPGGVPAPRHGRVRQRAVPGDGRGAPALQALVRWRTRSPSGGARATTCSCGPKRRRRAEPVRVAVVPAPERRPPRLRVRGLDRLQRRGAAGRVLVQPRVPGGAVGPAGRRRRGDGRRGRPGRGGGPGCGRAPCGCGTS